MRIPISIVVHVQYIHIFVDISVCYAYVNDIVRHILCLIERIRVCSTLKSGWPVLGLEQYSMLLCDEIKRDND